MSKKKEITNAEILRTLEKQGVTLEKHSRALEKQGLALEEQSLALEKQGLALEEQSLALEKQGLALEKQGRILQQHGIMLANLQVGVQEIHRDMATKTELKETKSEILDAVDEVMKELKDHRLEDKSTFSLYLELKSRQDRRDKAFAKALGLDLEKLDEE